MQNQNRFFDDLSQLMNNAAGVAQGVKSETETFFRARMERWLSDMNLVTREEFEAVRDMAQKAREENDALRARLDAMDARMKDKD